MREMDRRSDLLLKVQDVRFPMDSPVYDSPLCRKRVGPVRPADKALGVLPDKNINSIIRHHLHSFRSPAKAASHHRM